MPKDEKGGGSLLGKRKATGSTKKARVRLQSQESESVDVLGSQTPWTWYGLLLHVEDEMVGRVVIRQHLFFECINAHWFDTTDSKNYPPVSALARVAQMCHVELVISPEILHVISNTINVPHFHSGNWLALHFGEKSEMGVPVDVYWPAEGSDDPATIGARSTLEYINGFSRVRPPNKLIALKQFWDE